MRIGAKLMLLTAVVVAIASALLNTFFGSTLEAFLIDHTKAGLVRQVRLAALHVADHIATQPVDQIADFLGNQLEVRVTIIDSDGVVLGDSKVADRDLASLDDHGQRPEVVEALAGGFGRSVRRSDTLGIDMLYVAGIVPGGAETVLRLALPMSELSATRHAVQGVLWFSLLGGLLVVGASSFGLSRLLTRHITYLSSAARSMAGGEYTHRVAVSGVSIPEIRDLASALNEMRMQTQERIEQIVMENSRLEALLAGISEGILVTEQDGRIRMTNQRFDRLFDVVNSESVGRMPIEVLRNPAIQDAIADTLDVAEGRSLEVVLSGVLDRHLDVHTAPILRDGECIGSVTVFYDISEIRRLEKVRKDFVANVSHELRTPLTTIKGCAETLADGALSDPEAAKRFVESINTHAGRLHSIVDDLLDMAHLESDNLAIALQAVEVDKLVDSAVETVAGIARDAGIDIRCDIEPGAVTTADPSMLRQAIVNLLSNAIKYSEGTGVIEVRTRRGGLTDPAGGIPFASPEPVFRPLDRADLPEVSGERLFLEVSDSGVGIPSEDLPRVFERFYRVDKGRSRAIGGTGLGLAIVRHIVEAHGQRAYVLSELGKGTTFGFSLPAA